MTPFSVSSLLPFLSACSFCCRQEVGKARPSPYETPPPSQQTCLSRFLFLEVDGSPTSQVVQRYYLGRRQHLAIRELYSLYDLQGLFVVMGLMIIWFYGNMAICQYGNMFTLKNIKFPNATGSFILCPLAFSLLYSFDTVMGESQLPS